MNPPVNEIANLIARFREHVVAVGTETSGKRFDRDPDVVAICEWLVGEPTLSSSSPREPDGAFMTPSQVLSDLESCYPTRAAMKEAIGARIFEKAAIGEFPGTVAIAAELLAERRASGYVGE